MRTWLFVPADDEPKVVKALGSTADIVILDLEDGVGDSPERKTLAREVVARVLSAHAEQRHRSYVRINALKSDFLPADLSAAIAAGAAGVVLPKCEGPGDVLTLARMLDEHECGKPSAATETSIVAIVTETARGVQYLPEFRGRLPRLQGLMWGAEDLCADLGGTANRSADGNYLSPYVAARDACLSAARASGVLAIDAVYTAFRDSEGLGRECAAHRALGFDAKAAIHPIQLAIIEQAFRPTPEQVRWAARIVQVFEQCSGAAAMDGSMIDAPHLQRARNILRALS